MNSYFKFLWHHNALVIIDLHSSHSRARQGFQRNATNLILRSGGRRGHGLQDLAGWRRPLPARSQRRPPLPTGFEPTGPDGICAAAPECHGQSWIARRTGVGSTEAIVRNRHWSRNRVLLKTDPARGSGSNPSMGDPQTAHWLLENGIFGGPEGVRRRSPRRWILAWPSDWETGLPVELSSADSRGPRSQEPPPGLVIQRSVLQVSSTVRAHKHDPTRR